MSQEAIEGEPGPEQILREALVAIRERLSRRAFVHDDPASFREGVREALDEVRATAGFALPVLELLPAGGPHRFSVAGDRDVLRLIEAL